MKEESEKKQKLEISERAKIAQMIKYCKAMKMSKEEAYEYILLKLPKHKIFDLSIMDSIEHEFFVDKYKY